MKTEEEIRSQLERTYEHRLSLRIERKMKPVCRNCVMGEYHKYDLGEFGTAERWSCAENRVCDAGCGFVPKNTPEQIEQEMIDEISDPTICGAKEPKIGVLLWMLHDASKRDSNKVLRMDRSDFIPPKVGQKEEFSRKGSESEGFLKWIRRFF